MNKQILIAIPCWGPSHTANLMELCLPSLFFNRNLEDWHGYQFTILIHSIHSDHTPIKNHDTYPAISAKTNFEFYRISANPFGSKYDLMAECHKDAARIARTAKCPLMIIPPDTFFHSHAMDAIKLKLDTQAPDAILVPTFRNIDRDIHSKLKFYEISDDLNDLAVTKNEIDFKKISDLTTKSLHPEMEKNFPEHPDFNPMSSGLPGGIIAFCGCKQPHFMTGYSGSWLPLYLGTNAIASTSDDDFIKPIDVCLTPRIIGSSLTYVTVTPSDQFLIFSWSPTTHTHKSFGQVVLKYLIPKAMLRSYLISNLLHRNKFQKVFTRPITILSDEKCPNTDEINVLSYIDRLLLEAREFKSKRPVLRLLIKMSFTVTHFICNRIRNFLPNVRLVFAAILFQKPALEIIKKRIRIG
ncbi:hypothetical protein OAQ35_03985 [Litorivicinus sp.]|nr:hypothetical protein [Litorivicinus sp.]